jgi:hypothetical protein
MSRNLGALTLLDPSGPAWPVMGVLYLYLFTGYDLIIISTTGRFNYYKYNRTI